MRKLAIIQLGARRLALRHLGAAMWLLAAPFCLCAQTPAQISAPYAAIDRAAIDYAGPGRNVAHDLPGNEVRIGLIIPLSGPRKSEGEALLAAAQIALDDEALTSPAHNMRLTLAARDEAGLWGRASSEIVKLVVDDRAIALITSPDGRAAHLAEQVGNRLGVPVLSLATDSQNTQINIPWFFRMVPDDAAQARLFAEDIYRKRGLSEVLVIMESDHDGKVGREEFLKAARRLGAAEPTSAEIAPTAREMTAVAARINNRSPQAVVIWASAEVAARALAALAESGSSAEIYVCHKALREPFTGAANAMGAPNIWITTAADERGAYRADFDLRFRQRAGAAPNPAAREMYDAVRLVAAGVRAAGPNRARLRDRLARLEAHPGVSGLISFDGAGNNHTGVALIRWK